MGDFMRLNDPEGFRTFLEALLEELPQSGPVVGVTAGEQSTLISLGNAAINTVANEVTANNAADAAREDRIRLVAQFAAYARPVIKRLKTHSSYSPVIGEKLGVIAPNPQVVPAALKPQVTVSVTMGVVRLRVRCPGAESYLVLVRLAGQPGWTPLDRFTRASYDDSRPLAHAGVPEVREYIVQAYIGDEPVGQPSDPKVVVFAGQMAA